MSTASTGNFEMMEALQALALDKGISVDSLLEALANALVSAYKRMPGAAEEAYVTIDADNLDFRVYGQELDEDGNVAREWDATPEVGRFARIHDPEGNPIELWEPPATTA